LECRINVAARRRGDSEKVNGKKGQLKTTGCPLIPENCNGKRRSTENYRLPADSRELQRKKKVN
jgi:hypothetical protein